MKVLVLGGTGAMGVHLVKLLVQSGNDVFVTSRRNYPSDENVNFIQGDAREIDFLRSNLSTHWDAIVDFMVYSTEEFRERVNLFLACTQQYVFLSSSRVYAESELPLTESSPRLLNVSKDKDFLLTDEYSLAKARQEDILTNSEKKNWTIIRPYITYSENRLQLGVLEKEDWLYRALQGRTIVFSKEIASKVTTMTYGLDVSEGILRLIGKQEALGEAFHITTNESRAWSDILSIYLQVIDEQLGYKPKVIFQNLDGLLNWRKSKYQVIYDRLYDRKFDNNKIASYLNHYTSIDVGLRQCLMEFIKNQQFNSIDWKSEATKDKIAKEFTRLSEISDFKSKIKYLVYRYIF